jgi:cytosolic 5'-nucleotidase 3
MHQDIVHIKNKEELQQKIEQLKQGGASALHVISDFDKTLTKVFRDGKSFRSVIAILRDEKYLTPDYPERAEKLFEKYHPYEIDQNISVEEKNEKMLEWWSTHKKLIVECGLHKEVIQDVISKDFIVLRDGADTFFSSLDKHEVPLLIFSSGLGDFIEAHIKAKGKDTANVHVISNFFTFDTAGKATGYSEQIIHVFNKNEVALKETPYYEAVKERKNVLLLGDSMGDLQMSEGLEHDCILRIGFLNKDEEQSLEKYMDAFDMVILHDGTLEPVNAVLQKIFA